MKLPLSWLSDYTDMTGITPKEDDAKLTMSGSKVEEVYYLGAEIDNVVTGKILEVRCRPSGLRPSQDLPARCRQGGAGTDRYRRAQRYSRVRWRDLPGSKA